MKKRILRFLTLTLAILTVFTLIVSCSPKSELTDERITAENVETEEDPVLGVAEHLEFWQPIMSGNPTLK